ncbi:MAG TPA: hypothetical protein VF086_01370 [Propionibacteriaceae bacterium]
MLVQIGSGHPSHQIGGAEDSDRLTHNQLFPWQSGSDGRDETPTQPFNPRTNSWQPDHSRLQRQVRLAIAYSIFEYAAASGDETFLVEKGVDLIVEILRCVASMATTQLHKQSLCSPGHVQIQARRR